MAELKLGRLPDRTPVKLTIAVLPELAVLLDEYAAVYVETYGVAASVTELAPAMLKAFLDADKGFAKARAARTTKP